MFLSFIDHSLGISDLLFQMFSGCSSFELTKRLLIVWVIFFIGFKVTNVLRLDKLKTLIISSENIVTLLERPLCQGLFESFQHWLQHPSPSPFYFNQWMNYLILYLILSCLIALHLLLIFILLAKVSFPMSFEGLNILYPCLCRSSESTLVKDKQMKINNLKIRFSWISPTKANLLFKQSSQSKFR